MLASFHHNQIVSIIESGCFCFKSDFAVSHSHSLPAQTATQHNVMLNYCLRKCLYNVMQHWWVTCQLCIVASCWEVRGKELCKILSANSLLGLIDKSSSASCHFPLLGSHCQWTAHGENSSERHAAWCLKTSCSFVRPFVMHQCHSERYTGTALVHHANPLVVLSCRVISQQGHHHGQGNSVL